MEKVCLIITGILLTLTSFSQVPFRVEKKLKVVDGIEKEVMSDLTHISIKLTSSLKAIKLMLKNEDVGVKIATKKMKIASIEKKGEGIGGLRIYQCESNALGNVVIEEELNTMTGKVKIDRDKDGVFEEVFILH